MCHKKFADFSVFAKGDVKKRQIFPLYVRSINLTRRMYMKKVFLFLAVVGIFVVSAMSAYAHSGRTNAYGCHWDHRTGTYHCH